MVSLPLVRLGVQIVSALGVTKVVGDVIARNTIVLNTADLIRVKVGEVVISSMITHHTKKYVDSQIDSAVEWYEKRKTETDLKAVE